MNQAPEAFADFTEALSLHPDYGSALAGAREHSNAPGRQGGGRIGLGPAIQITRPDGGRSRTAGEAYRHLDRWRESWITSWVITCD